MSDYIDYGFPDARPSHTFSYLEKPLLQLLNPNHNRCILDLGCGNGYLVNYLLQHGFNAYGTDASAEGIAIAREAHPGRFFIQDLASGELPQALQNLPIDTIISTEVIEHLYHPKGLTDFCNKVLGPNGKLIISTPYHGYLKNLSLSLLNKWDAHHGPSWHGGHIKFWSKAALSQLLSESGFKVTHFTGCGRIPYLWKSMIIKAIKV
ncbi:class I SAM-dependent methyltransferase [Mucilaginibacter gynuensis]|uniref:Class I SAM-dependent methyltransferase n=1 Tax=Mucilaginibacter gynuensis TaxID=1302236 RepID=A0ABP8GQ07_9SPHI